MPETTWRVPVRGSLSDKVIGQLTDAGVTRLGGGGYWAGPGGPPKGMSETHGLYVAAESAEDAAKRVRDALGDHPYYIDEDDITPGTLP